MTIRAAEPRDAAALAELMAVLGYPTTEAVMRARMDALATEGSYRTWVAEEDGGVQGAITCRSGISTARGEREVEVGSLVVRGAVQGRGIGSLLLETGERWALSIGAASVRLGSRAERAQAHRFYERRGYAVTGVRMRKPLGAPAPG
jgi:GNAT superfamily N-acetyltransferase